MAEHFDVVVVGAGISGVGQAYHLRKRCPDRSYVILEGRAALGGTWDLFRYPGIRSDSDMHTLGFAFHPWRAAKSIADGPSIRAYVEETAQTYGIDRHIRFRHHVTAASWSTADARWTVEATGPDGAPLTFTCNFLCMCSGYYKYANGYTPHFEGVESFGGRIVHPQLWPEDLEYDGKRVVVIGSGATAVTLVPEMAKEAAHVTMLQRSPTYVLSIPAQDRVADALKKRLPEQVAHQATLWKNVAVGLGFYQFCRKFPRVAKRLLVSGVAKGLGDEAAAREHFTPRYDPWDQRICFVPDGDMFDAIKSGKASVVTDHVETFTERGIRLRSGRELEADVVVTATGLELLFLGGAAIELDGRRIASSETMVYRGCMLQDVPNFAFAVGYTNASWTLKCDLASTYFCRAVRHVEERKLGWFRPHLTDPTVRKELLIDFSSGYVQRARDRMPPQGSKAPWKLHQNYFRDRKLMGSGAIEDGVLQFG